MTILWIIFNNADDITKLHHLYMSG